MATDPDIGVGATLTWGGGAMSGTTMKLRDVSFTGETKEAVEITNMSSPVVSGSVVNEYIPGALEPGEIQAEVIYDHDIVPTPTQTGKHTAIALRFGAPPSHSVGGACIASGFATSWVPSVPVKGLHVAQLGIQMTGLPVWSAAAPA
jgi:hypothetical protein